MDTKKQTDGVHLINGFFWFPITAVNARVPRPGFVSAGAGFTGTSAITQAEQAQLESGELREETFQRQYSNTTTNNQMKTDLVSFYNARATAVLAEPPTRQFYGQFYDGTTWSQ